MAEQLRRKRSKWDAPEKEKPTLLGAVKDFYKEFREALAKHWPAALGVVGGFVFFLFVIWLLTREYHGDITGKVTFNGKPIPYGRVTFVGEGGRKKSKSGKIINGVYTIKDCPTGRVKVSVESMRAARHDLVKGVPALARGVKLPAAEEPPPPELVGKFEPIPPDYGNADTSRLTYKVGWGSQTHNLDLIPR